MKKKTIDFPAEQACPLCQGRFRRAELKTEYDPVVVILCPHCNKLLWRPGLDASSSLFAFDPNADAGGI
jgi:hypothetical protein